MWKVICKISCVLFVCTLGSGRYPYPYPENEVWPCDSLTDLPQINSYHVHVTFNGSDHNSSLAAMNLHSSYIKYYLSNINTLENVTLMEVCPFSHDNNYHPNYQQVCAFSFNTSMTQFPFFTMHLFGNVSNYAFYIPDNDSIFSKTQKWFRQHTKLHGNFVSYAIHTNTGCEIKDHTEWMITAYDYWPGQDTMEPMYTGCCHYGPPPKCYCNSTRYILSQSNNYNTYTYMNKQNNILDSGGDLCLTADMNSNLNYTGLLTLENCENNSFTNLNMSGMNPTYWIETAYTDTFIQLENYGVIEFNTFKCIGIMNSNNNNNNNSDNKMNNDMCINGNEIGIIDCYQDNLQTNLFAFDYELNTIRAINCTDKNLCLSVTNNSVNVNQWMLDDCNTATKFKREFYLGD